MILLQIALFLALFTGIVKLGAKDNALNVLYFYPRPVQERAFAIGLADREDIRQKQKRFMLLFLVVMLAALLLIVSLWNRVNDYRSAYLQVLLFLEVMMNWYDGIVIDRLQVGHSKFWILPGTKEIPFVKLWREKLRKRTILPLVLFVGAAVIALLVALFDEFYKMSSAKAEKFPSAWHKKD